MGEEQKVNGEEMKVKGEEMKAKGEEMKVKGEEIKAMGEEMKAEDEEPLPKRQRVLEARILRQEVRAPSYWDRLPYNLTVQIYSYLKNSDRRAMARVCRAWYKSFKDPSLWRSKEFTLGGPYATHTGRNFIRFASMFGSGLQNVALNCDHRTNLTCKHITATMEKLLGKLENARLCRLELLCLQLNMFLPFPNLGYTVCGCLVKLLKTQTALKHVVFFNCQFEYFNGTEVMKALSKSSGQTLESLYLNSNYQTSLDVFEANTYLDIMTKFTNLREISVNYNFISDETLQRWTVHLKAKLQLLRIIVWGNEPPDHVITSGTWRHLNKACPQLQVELSIHHVSHADDIIELLALGMPLTSFCLRSNIGSAHDFQLASALTHLADNFDKKLKSLTLEFPWLEDSVDNEIVRIVEKCRELTAMRVPASAALGVANAIQNAFRERQVRNVRLQAGITERFDNRYNEQQFQEIERTFHDMLRNIPNVTVELIDSEYRGERGWLSHFLLF